MTRVVAVGSVKGAGGVTASALGIAAACGERLDTILVEVDPSGGSLLGWCPTLDPTRGGVYEAVFSANRGGLVPFAQLLGDIVVVVAQGDPHRITAAIERPRGWRTLLDGLAEVVLLDVGRLFPGSPSFTIAAVADRVVMVSPAEPGPLAATIEWIGRGGQHTAGSSRIDPDRIAVLTVDTTTGHRQRVDPSRLGTELGVGYLGHLPADDGTVELLCRGTSLAHRRMRRSKLSPALRAIASEITEPVRAGASR